MEVLKILINYIPYKDICKIKTINKEINHYIKEYPINSMYTPDRLVGCPDVILRELIFVCKIMPEPRA